MRSNMRNTIAFLCEFAIAKFARKWFFAYKEKKRQIGMNFLLWW